MSREWAGKTARDGWVMKCDQWDPRCPTVSEVQHRQSDLPLERFATEGWFIASTHGDLCPKCVEERGGIDAVTAARAALGGPGAPLVFSEAAS